MQQSDKHFYWLDLLRFTAAFIVVVVHARGTAFVEYGLLLEADKTLLTAISFAITRIGNEAVVVFFVLSGFLVGGRALERIANGVFRPADFAIDRFVRIMLPLVPALLLTAIVRLIIDGEFNLIYFVGNIFSLQGVLVPIFGFNAPLWSLSYEVWFYILTGAVGIALSTRELSNTVAFVLLLLAMIFTSLGSVYLYCWLIGALCYLRLPKILSIKILLGSLALCAYSVVAIQLGTKSDSVSVDFLDKYFPSVSYARIILSLGIAIFIQQILFFKPDNLFLNKLNALGTVLAKSSYTLYLVHFPVLQLMAYLGLKKAEQINYYSVGIFLLSIFVCLLVSWVMYLLFEKHTTYVRNKLKYIHFTRLKIQT